MYYLKPTIQMKTLLTLLRYYLGSVFTIHISREDFEASYENSGFMRMSLPSKSLLKA